MPPLVGKELDKTYFKLTYVLLVYTAATKAFSNNLLTCACTCVGIHPGRVDPASPIELTDSQLHDDVPVSLHSLALQPKPSLLARFESARAYALHTLPPFGLNTGDT